MSLVKSSSVATGVAMGTTVQRWKR